MARKKVLFVIVEGPSDEDALSLLFSRYFDKNVVHVEVTHGDITSQKGVKADNIVSKIGDIVRNYAGIYALKQVDFLGVIHIVDMDGVYISDNYIVEEAGLDKVLYSLSEIRCSNKQAIVKRNSEKRENLNRIIFQTTVWKSVPYKVYYMASNLDHVLYNKQNNDDEGKKKDSMEFSKKYKDDLNAFVNYMTTSDFAVIKDYKESWEFVKRDKHSLGRYSNLGMVFCRES